MVERSDLAVLEFLMSKQPRGPVRLTAGNSVGASVSNIFVDMKKFQKRFNEMNEKASKESQVAISTKLSIILSILIPFNVWHKRLLSTC